MIPGSGVLKSTLPSSCLSYKMQDKEANRDGFDGSGSFGGCGGSDRDRLPPFNGRLIFYTVVVLNFLEKV